jgi:xylulokinase
MLRAVIEGLNYQFLQILNGLASGVGLTADKLVAVGGGTKNALAMQNKADMAGRPLETPQLDEATPLGAAILAGIGVGLYRDEKDAFERVYRPGKTYQPDPARTAEYAELFPIYQEIYPALAGVHHPLHERL